MIDIGELFKKENTDKFTKDRTYTPIPTDRYDVHVHFTQIDLTKETPRVLINYKIVQDHEHFAGRILFSSFQLNQQGAAILKQTLRKLGIDSELYKTLDDLNTGLGEIVGRKCLVYAKLKSFMKHDGSFGYSHTVYVNESEHDIDNQKSTGDALSGASKKNKPDDDFNFD